MDTQTQNNIRGMRLSDSPQGDTEDDLVFDPALDRQRLMEGTEEYLEELRHDFAKYNTGKTSFPESVLKISSALREWMLSYDRTKFYNQLAEEFHLQGADRIGVARVAWDIVLKSEWSLSGDLFRKYIGNVSVIPELVKRFSGEFIPQAQKLASVSDVISREITSNASGYGLVEEKKPIHAEIPLMQALGKFEKLGGQQVTNSKIVVKGQNDPVRPTIFNWLRAYRDELGVGAHDAVTRGQFLFHSLNGKGLSSDERDQVGMLLKSLDENVPLTIDAGRQEVLFQRQGVEKSFSNSGRTAPIAERPLPTRTADAPLKSGTIAPHVAGGNISRAVFELPAVQEQRISQTAVAPLKSGTTAPANRPSAFEQAKAIQEANRESRLSIANMNAETVELGRMDASAKGGQASATGERSTSHPVAPASQSVAPAPRAISFEPAKIDNFSFGSGRGSDLQGIENSPPESLRESFRAGGLRQPADQKAERPLSSRTSVVPPAGGASAVRQFSPQENMNVSAVSFSTNHVLPAEKERIREQGARNREQKIENSGRTAPKAERPLFASREQNASQIADAPARGGQADQTTAHAPAPVKQAPTPPPVNRFRITPTGHRDEVASDDTPSPHVVDLRG